MKEGQVLADRRSDDEGVEAEQEHFEYHVNPAQIEVIERYGCQHGHYKSECGDDAELALVDAVRFAL